MDPYDFQSFTSNLGALVNHGEIPMGRIDEAVRRILRVKFTAGLLRIQIQTSSMETDQISYVSSGIARGGVGERGVVAGADSISGRSFSTERRV
jgi:beta-glucosidase